MYRNSCLFDKLSRIPVEIANSESIQKSQTTEDNFSKTWRGKMQNIEDIIRQIK